jgi:class 3 adenylate cyclase
VTILFADVSGSMDLQAGLDPEEWAGIMQRFFEVLSDGVHRFEGTVDKFTGDGIMALFGAPIAHEDHARRACSAALHLAEAVSAYADDLRRTKGLSFSVRLGLNSGEVVVGGIGDDARMDYTALGHTVGLAQRMESLAEPGTAYLTEHTAGLVSRWFRLRDLGRFEVKGAPAPLGVFVLEAPRLRVGAITSPGGVSPLVGRAPEMAVLEAALARAEAGDAQVIGVVGDAGVGKSRLCDEFAQACAARGHTVRRTAGLSHARTVPFIPILVLLRDYFEMTDADTARSAREKVAGRLLLLDPEFEEALPLLFDFLEVPDPDRPPPRMSPDARMRRIFDVLRRLTQRRSERGNPRDRVGGPPLVRRAERGLPGGALPSVPGDEDPRGGQLPSRVPSRVDGGTLVPPAAPRSPES